MTEYQLLHSLAATQACTGETTRLLSQVLGEIHSWDLQNVAERDPLFLSRVVNKMIGIDAAGFLCERPERPDRLMDCFWQCVGMFSRTSREMTLLFERTRDAKVNLEASDSPLQGHFIISQMTLTGGAGLVPYREQDFRFFGQTQVLLHLLIGDLSLGLSNLRLQTEGHPGFLPILTPVMRAVSRLVNGEDEGPEEAI